MTRLLAASLFLLTLLAPSAQAASLSAYDVKVLNLLLYATIDYQQSVTMFYRQQERVELNPLLAERPSRESMALFGVASIAATYGLGKWLDDSLFKQVLIDSILMSEKLNIEENRRTIRYGSRRFETIMIVVHFTF